VGIGVVGRNLGDDLLRFRDPVVGLLDRQPVTTTIVVEERDEVVKSAACCLVVTMPQIVLDGRDYAHQPILEVLLDV
jgi:hypothetical protein